MAGSSNVATRTKRDAIAAELAARNSTRPRTLGVLPSGDDDGAPDTAILIDDSNADLFTPVVAVTPSDGDARAVEEHRITMRRATVFKLRAAGHSYDEIADRMASDPTVAHTLPKPWSAKVARSDALIYLDYLRGELQDSLLDVVELESSRLDRMLAAIWDKVELGNFKAIDTALRISERRSKLLGLDKAIEVDWRIEVLSLMDGGLVTAEQAAEQLGPEQWAIFVQWVEERRDERRATPAARRNPLLFGNGFGSGIEATVPPGTLLPPNDSEDGDDDDS